MSDATRRNFLRGAGVTGAALIVAPEALATGVNPRAFSSAAERGYIDDVIIPHETRPKVINALQTLLTKRVDQPKRKHGNIPL